MQQRNPEDQRTLAALLTVLSSFLLLGAGLYALSRLGLLI